MVLSPVLSKIIPKGVLMLRYVQTWLLKEASRQGLAISSHVALANAKLMFKSKYKNNISYSNLRNILRNIISYIKQ